MDLDAALTCTTSRPAQSRFAAALCTDANYLPYALFVARQLSEMHDLPDLDIVICVTGDCDIPASLNDLDLRICRISSGDTFKGLYLDARRTDAVYHRLALPHVFQDEYDRILYLDCDVFIQGGAFAPLFAIDMAGHAIAAVRDILQWSRPKAHVRAFQDFGLAPAKYFNSGVMLIDTAAYRASQLLERCIDFGRKNAARMRQHDQQLLNCVLHGDWLEISPMWNWQRPLNLAYAQVSYPVAIMHFIGKRKPWNDPDHRVPPRFKPQVNAFLREHFPDHASIPIRTAAEVPHFEKVKLAWNSFRRHGEMARYIARFPDDLLEAK